MPAVAPICGRVTTAEGRGISKAMLVLNGGFLSTPLMASSNPFGYFCFHNVDIGQTYMVAVSSKRYQFEESVRFTVFLDEITDMDFVALP